MFTSTEEEDFSSGKNKEDINWPITTDVRRVQVLYPKHDIKPNFLATAWLTISSLGIIYGDIGTSPLYVVQSMFTSPPSKEDVYGGISLVIWALTLVATIKYISIILNFNNHGEGGIFALMAMLPFSKMNRIPRALFVTLAIFGSALLIGDGVITPAISVLSAVQGLELGIHGIGRYAKWIAAFILLILFMSQRYGTAKLSTIFGPVMLLWFISIGVFGLLKIIDDPNILKAFSPVYGARFIGRHGSHGFIFLGVVVLSVTGVEALYADLGHFGAQPIRFSWFIIVYPSLLLNYIGQGALLIKEPNRYDNPFYHLVPHMFFWPIIILATIATIIASQSIITGSFSLVAQAISFGYFPRLKIQHTNKKVFGQIYIAELNFLLMVLTIVITIAFGSSAKLTAAYGLAVSGVMFLTSVIFTAVLRYKYKANWLLVILYAAVFYTVDLAFLGANSSKVPNGGWLPLAIGSVLALLMIIWKTGKEKVEDVLKETHIPLENVIKLARTNLLDRVPMVGVYMNSHFDLTPLSLSLLLPRTRTLASPAIFLTVKYLPVPFISDNDRILFHSLDENENPSLGSEQTEDLQSNEETTTNFELKSERTDEEKPDASSKTGSPSVTEDDYLKEEEELSGFVEFKPQDSINIYRVIAFYGYSEVVDLKQVLSRVIDEHPLRKPPPPPTNSSDEHALMITPELTFYLNRERIKADHKKFFLHRWWVYFYSILLRNARGVVDLFHLPYDSIVQVSAPVLL